MTTLLEAWSGAQKRLKTAGVDSPSIDARLLLEAAAGVTRLEMIGRPLPAADGRAGRAVRRLRRAPQPPRAGRRILGRKGFWKLMLQVTPDVLTPRPETETAGRHGAGGVSAGASGFPCWTWASAPARSCCRCWPSGPRPRGWAWTSPRRRWRRRGTMRPAWAWTSARPFFAPTGPRGWPTRPSTSWSSNPPYIPTGDIDEPGARGARPRAAPGARRRCGRA